MFLTNGLEERVKAEGQNSPADVILQVDAAKLAGAVDMGITQPVSSKELEAAVPAHLRDPDGHWFATTLRSRVIYASKDRVQQNAMTYEELADPKWKGKICIRSGQHPYNVSLIAASYRATARSKAAEWLKGVKANLAKKPSGGDRDVAKDILAGVCDIGVGNTYYIGLLRNDPDPAQKAWGNAVKVLDSSFAGGGTHVNISGAAVAKYAPNKAEAVKLIAFMTSDAAQALQRTRTTNIRSARASPTATPEALSARSSPTAFRLPRSRRTARPRANSSTRPASITGPAGSLVRNSP